MPDREATPQALWTASALLALLASSFVFADAFTDATGGQNEEVGAALFALALVLAVVGLVLRGSLSRWDARASPRRAWRSSSSARRCSPGS